MDWNNMESFNSWTESEKDRFSVNVVKGLIMDGVRNANSGHTGGPMSSADFVYILYKEFLNFNPDNPKWFNRDRFVLSAGHESMLLYSILTFTGLLKMDDLKVFRTFGSRTPGHPECDMTPGVDATSGPLGQGVAMGVGMAVAEVVLQTILGQDIVNHYTYMLAGDGDLQEPVSLGASAIAGHLGLSKLIMFYDSNKVQISGSTDRSDSTDYSLVFKGLGWQVIEIDGHDHGAIRSAIKKAQSESEKPSLIIGSTTIAKGSATMEGNAKTHGEPLSEEGIKATKAKLGLPEDKFYLPQIVLDHFRTRFSQISRMENEWNSIVEGKKKSDDFAKLWSQVIDGKLPELSIPYFDEDKPISTRKAFGAILTALADQIPNLVGGSADLEPSNQTGGFMKIVGDLCKENPGGRNIAFGVREFPMGAILNGMSLHGGIRPFGATFFVFSDYERPALRMRTLQHLPVISVYTHDSFYVGKDGPTHQPVEQISALRAFPNFLVLRPCDANEMRAVFQVALEQENRPSAFILSRQDLPIITPSSSAGVENVRRGAYVLQDCNGAPEIVLLATGSEVSLALEVSQLLIDKKVRVVSMPSWELFEEQSEDYKSQVLPSSNALRVSIEAGTTFGWERYTGIEGLEIGLNHFGASGDPGDLAREYGFVADAIVQKIKERL